MTSLSCLNWECHLHLITARIEETFSMLLSSTNFVRYKMLVQLYLLLLSIYSFIFNFQQHVILHVYHLQCSLLMSIQIFKHILSMELLQQHGMKKKNNELSCNFYWLLSEDAKFNVPDDVYPRTANTVKSFKELFFLHHWNWPCWAKL